MTDGEIPQKQDVYQIKIILHLYKLPGINLIYNSITFDEFARPIKHDKAEHLDCQTACSTEWRFTYYHISLHDRHLRSLLKRTLPCLYYERLAEWQHYYCSKPMSHLFLANKVYKTIWLTLPLTVLRSHLWSG